jgi:serine/threonine protein kinase
MEEAEGRRLRAKITDFGILPKLSPTVRTGLVRTQTNVMMGTRSTYQPEQLQGQQARRWTRGMSTRSGLVILLRCWLFGLPFVAESRVSQYRHAPIQSATPLSSLEKPTASQAANWWI